MENKFFNLYIYFSNETSNTMKCLAADRELCQKILSDSIGSNTVKNIRITDISGNTHIFNSNEITYVTISNPVPA